MVAINRNSAVALAEKPSTPNQITLQSKNTSTLNTQARTEAPQANQPNRENNIAVNTNATGDDGLNARSFNFPTQTRVTTSLGDRINSVQNTNHNQQTNHPEEHGHSTLETVNHSTHSVVSKFELTGVGDATRRVAGTRAGQAVTGLVARVPGVRRSAEIGGNIINRVAGSTVGRAVGSVVHSAHHGAEAAQVGVLRGTARVAQRASLPRLASGATRIASLATPASHGAHAAHAVSTGSRATSLTRVALRAAPVVGRGAALLGRVTPALGFVAGVTGAALAVRDARNARTTAGRTVGYIRAGLNVVSAGASLVPGAGTAVSLLATGADIGLSWVAKRRGWN